MTFEVENQIRAWELPSYVETKLLSNPSLCKYLLKEKSKFPLPTHFIPQQIQFWFDNRLVHQIDTIDRRSDRRGEQLAIANGEKELVLGRLPEVNWSQIDEVSFIEVRLDGDCGLFLVDRHRVIDRLSNFVVTL